MDHFHKHEHLFVRQIANSNVAASWIEREKNLSTIGATHLRSTSGLEGTPPGVFTVTGWDRVPSPFLVRAAT